MRQGRLPSLIKEGSMHQLSWHGRLPSLLRRGWGWLRLNYNFNFLKVLIL